MLEAQLPWIASLQGFAQFAPIYFILKLAIFMSEENVIILTTCALFWLVDRRIAVIALLLVLGSEYVNFVLKWTVHQPRPYWMTGSILALSRQPDFGFPTAYAQDALVYWTYIAYSLNKKFASRRFWLFPAIIVPLASFASVAFGANFFHDTVAGLIIGASILLCARYAASRLNSFFETRPRLVPILVFLSAPLMILLVTIRGMTIGAVKLEGTWKQFAMAGTDLPPYLTFAPWNSNAIFSICAAVLAVGLYLELANRDLVATFTSALSRRLVLTRLILGLSGLVLIKFVLILAIESSRDLSVPAVFFLGYFSIAAWALILAPILSNRIEHSNWFAEIFNPAAEVA